MFHFFKKRKETKFTHHSTTGMPVKQHKAKAHPLKQTNNHRIPRFKNYPQEYTYCSDYVKRLETFFEIDCRTNHHYHYIALNKTKRQLIEIHTRVLGCVEGTDPITNPIKYVLDFVKPPQEITIEDFLDIAESKCEGIRILYHGINQDNLSLYKDMEKWYWHQSLKNSAATVPCQTKILYQFEQLPLAVRNREKNSEIYPLVAISEFLVSNDFVFERAIIGGGITEITHCGTLSYGTEYTNLADFRDNFKRDIDLARAQAAEEYGGWASIDYRYILVILKYGEVELRAEIGDKMTILWNNITVSTQPLIDKTNQKMIDILGEQVELRKRYYIK